MTEPVLTAQEASMTGTQQPEDRRLDLDLDMITKALGKRSFCTLATVSPANRPHVAGLLYEAVSTGPADTGIALYASTLRTSRKARNVAANPYVGVVIPIRRVPVGGPPSTLQFQATAEILAVDDPRITELVDAGKLKSITSHGELELPDNCFLRIEPLGRINTYGLGMSLWQLIRDPLNGAGHVDLPA